MLIDKRAPQALWNRDKWGIERVDYLICGQQSPPRTLNLIFLRLAYPVPYRLSVSTQIDPSISEGTSLALITLTYNKRQQKKELCTYQRCTGSWWILVERFLSYLQSKYQLDGNLQPADWSFLSLDNHPNIPGTYSCVLLNVDLIWNWPICSTQIANRRNSS